MGKNITLYYSFLWGIFTFSYSPSYTFIRAVQLPLPSPQSKQLYAAAEFFNLIDSQGERKDSCTWLECLQGFSVVKIKFWNNSSVFTDLFFVIGRERKNRNIPKHPLHVMFMKKYQSWQFHRTFPRSCDSND